MKFVFTGRDASGKTVRGSIEASTQEEAVTLLQEKEVIPTSVKSYNEQAIWKRELGKAWEGVKPHEMVLFFRQLASLISAKVSVLQSVRVIETQLDNLYFRSILKRVADDVEEGTALSAAFSRHDVFNSLVINMLRAGEVSGRLEQSIEHIAENLESNYELNAKIKGALVYPAFVISVAAIIGFIVITWILPQLTDIIRELGVEIPWYTVIIMAVGDFMRSFWWAVLIVIMGAIGSFMYYVNTKEGKDEWASIQLKLPVVGRLLKYIYLARFAENLSILLNGGIPLVRALIIVSDVVNSKVYQQIILRAADEVKKGSNINVIFQRSPHIPAAVSQMIRIGEESGQLSETLGNVGEFYKKEADRMAKNLTSIIEPALIVVLGIGVAIMVFGILMPIYSIIDTI